MAAADEPTEEVSGGAAAEWGPDTSLPWMDSSVGDALRARVTASSGRPALFWPTEAGPPAWMTYGELLERSEAAARALLAMAAPGEHVAVCAPNSLEWVVLFYGAALAGTPLVPLNPSLTEPELAALIQRTTPSVLLTVTDYRGAPLLERARTLAQEHRDLRWVLDLAGWPESAGSVAGPEPGPVGPHDRIMLQPTSGTTGAPKAAVLTHAGLLNASRFLVMRWGTSAEDVVCTCLPYHHLGGSSVALLGSMSAGSAVSVVAGWDARQMMRLAHDVEATELHLVPTMAVDVLGLADSGARRLSRLRRVMSGGARCTPSLMQELEAGFGVAVLNAYGQSESTGAATTVPEDPPHLRWETVGRPLPHREVRIRRLAGAGPAGLGEVGELEMRSPITMTGYHGQPEATAEVLSPDGWVRTGDLASLDDRGYLRLHGRLRDVIIRGGENIYPKEIELVLTDHPEVVEACVVGLADRRLGEVVGAAVRLVPGSELTSASLAAFAARSLARFKLPAHYLLLDELPMIGPGKVDQRQLKTMLQAEHGSPDDPPST